jgi:hypothetical protein
MRREKTATPAKTDENGIPGHGANVEAERLVRGKGAIATFHHDDLVTTSR